MEIVTEEELKQAFNDLHIIIHQWHKKLLDGKLVESRLLRDLTYNFCKGNINFFLRQVRSNDITNLDYYSSGLLELIKSIFNESLD